MFLFFLNFIYCTINKFICNFSLYLYCGFLFFTSFWTIIILSLLEKINLHFFYYLKYYIFFYIEIINDYYRNSFKFLWYVRFRLSFAINCINLIFFILIQAFSSWTFNFKNSKFIDFIICLFFSGSYTLILEI